MATYSPWKALLLCPVVSAALPAVRLSQRDSGERVFVDDDGRERFFHGTNAIVKGPPWIPSRTSFDPEISLTAEDFRLMQSAGLNVIRLGVMWPGVEPARGAYNETYLETVRDLAKEAASYGIYILADMHQDLLSERFCGEGLPLWAVPDDPKFPLPLSFPFRKGADGLPTRSDCRKHHWASYHATWAAGNAFERLFTNQDNLTDAWGSFWAKVLQTFSGSSELLGVNIINEPFVGNPYQDPALMIPEVADRMRLQPAYDTVARHIRAADSKALIFFPGTTMDRTGRRFTDFLPLGFQHAPGGKEFADRAVTSFHFYVPPQSEADAKRYFQVRLKDAQRLGTGLFLTESCCWPFFRTAAPIAESMGVSWIHWEWKPFFKETEASNRSQEQWAAFGADKTGDGGWPFWKGVFNASMLHALARPYAQAIAGSFVTASFHEPSGAFRLVFKANPSIQAPTIISAPAPTYPAGVEVLVRPDAACKVKSFPGRLELVNAGIAQGEEVTVEVTPKQLSVVV